MSNYHINNGAADLTALVNRINDLYITYRGRYLITSPSTGGYYIPRVGMGYRKLTDKVVAGHLSGEYAIGVFSGASVTKFVCFDVDNDPDNTVPAVRYSLVSAGIPDKYIHISFSGSKGYHLEIFFDEPVSVDVLKRLYYWILHDTGLDKTSVEFRPTGSQSIKLPLSKHPQTHRMCWFVDKNTLEDIPSPNYIFGIEQMPHGDILDIIKSLNLPVEEHREPDADSTPASIPLTLLAPDESLPVLKRAGERHTMLLRVGLHGARQGLNRSQIEQYILNWWEQQDKSLANTPHEETVIEIKDIAGWCSRFVFHSAGYQRTDGMVSVDDIKWVMGVKNGYHRLILFLMMIGGMRHGRWVSSLDKMAAILGMGRATVIRGIQALKEAGMIEVTQGATTRTEASYRRNSNTYRVLRQSPPQAPSDILVDGDAQKDFYGVYYRVLEQAFPQGFKNKLTDKQKKHYDEWKRKELGDK